jgi:hypothetical protein
VNWKNLRQTAPISPVFGFDRGTPIDRYYIENFLRTNAHHISGDVLEIAENTYTNKFGKNIRQSLILDYSAKNRNANLIGDLTDKTSLTEGYVDCFICTQTFNFIYNIKEAIEGAHFLLRKNGVLLVTLAGISQISRFDMDRWGDYWRFTSKSAENIFSEVFGRENVTVSVYGNVLSAVALLHGISTEELTPAELDIKDDNYQVTIAVVARKV